MLNDITVIILAGGESSRIGLYKPLIKLGNRVLVNWVILNIKEIAYEILISVHNRKQENALTSIIPHEYIISNKVRFVIDKIETTAPAVGVYSALSLANRDYIFVTGCDMPFITNNIVLNLLNEIYSYDGVIPKWPNGYIEPLVAIYRRNKLKNAITNAFEKGKIAMRNIISTMNINYVDIHRISQKPEITFLNINTNEDLLFAQSLLKRHNEIPF